MSNKPKVIAILPNAGMCNQFFCWSRALVFAKKYNLDFYVFGWNRIRIGPWIRGENRKRFYGTFFKKDRRFLERLKFQFLQKTKPEKIKVEPVFNLIPSQIGEFNYVHFYDIPRVEEHKIEYFADLRSERSFIKDQLFNLIHKQHLDKALALPKAHIGMHIRRGDFKGRKEYLEDEYYINLILKIREKEGKDIAVTLFSDGTSTDLKEILKLPNVSMAQNNSDIIDFLSLSQSKIIVTSLRSTFSYWAGFVSEASIILHPEHVGGRIRQTKEGLFEGTFEEFINS